jgi:predicted ferric reductase
VRDALLWSEPAPATLRTPRRGWVTAWDLGVLAAANAAVILGLWWRAGGVTDVHDAVDALTSAGRLLGLLGAYSALVQLLLLARVPALERTLGFDRLAIWHRRNGKACLYLVLAHVVLIVAGYAASERVSPPVEFWHLETRFPGVLPATLGFALLVMVAVSSFVIYRRRLRYETWYFVHLYAYLAVALAFSHQLATGTEFIGDPVARSYWYALYLGTLGTLVAYRLAAPALRALFHDLRVEDVSVEGPGVVSLRLTGRHLDRLGARSGQFFLFRFLTRDRWWEAHPFSLSAAPDGRSLRITVKALGDFTARLARVRPGTRVIAEGPYGAFTEDARRRPRVAFIAGGVGITPVRALLEDVRGDVVVVYRVAAEGDVIFRDELERLVAARRARLHYVVGDHRDAGERGLLGPGQLRALVPDLLERDVYVCGPAGMVDTTLANLREAGVARTHIHAERFAL